MLQSFSDCWRQEVALTINRVQFEPLDFELCQETQVPAFVKTHIQICADLGIANV
jgi:hypothetical protein